MIDQDKIQRFLFEKIHARGELVHLNESFLSLIKGHNYPPNIQALLGEAMVSVSLLITMLKFDGKMTLQIQGDGEVSLLVMQIDNHKKIRGMARFKGTPSGETLSDLFGEAHMVISLQGVGSKERYQGIVAMDQPSLSGCLEGYFQQSEQLETHIRLFVSESQASGILLQSMPVPEGQVSDPDDWKTLCVLTHTLKQEEMNSISNDVLILRLFNEFDVRLFEHETICFHCSCSREKINTTLKGLGQSELEDLLEEQGVIEVDCEFCNQHYEFDQVDISTLFVQQVQLMDRHED